jgi:hypothetical protein
MEDLKLTPGVRSSPEQIGVGVKLCSCIREVPIYDLHRDIGFVIFHSSCANVKLVRKLGHMRFLPNPLQFTIQ